MLQMLAVPLAMAAGGYMLDKQMGGDGTKGAVMGGAAGAGKGPAGAAAGAGGTTAKVGSSMMMNPLIQNPAMANSLAGGANLMGGLSTIPTSSGGLDSITSVTDMLGKGYDSVAEGLGDLDTMDKLELGLLGADRLTPKNEGLLQADNTVAQGQFNPENNTGLNIEVATPATTIAQPQTEEEIEMRKLRELYGSAL